MKKMATKKVTLNELSNTIDNLAIMVAKGFDNVYKEIGEVKKDINEIKNDVAEVKENLASTRRDVLSMGDRFTMKFEFHELASRVSVLEQKRKIKK